MDDFNFLIVKGETRINNFSIKDKYKIQEYWNPLSIKYVNLPLIINFLIFGLLL